MKNKLLVSVFLVTLIVSGIAFFGTQPTQAQVAYFPPGCSSALGYSVTTGAACSGTPIGIPRFPEGCTTALGYSVTTDLPCSGSSIAIQWLAGCSSLIGYSTIDGAPCNGTPIATTSEIIPPPITITSPGLPVTGAGGNAFWNVVLLLFSGTVAVMGSTYLVSNYRRSS